MPRDDRRIPFDAMFGGARPPGAEPIPAGPPPGEAPMGPGEFAGPGGAAGGDIEGARELIAILLQDPIMEQVILEKLAMREETGGPRGRGGPPPPPPMSPSGEPLPGEPGPGAGVTPFLDRLGQTQGGRR